MAALVLPVLFIIYPCFNVLFVVAATALSKKPGWLCCISVAPGVCSVVRPVSLWGSAYVGSKGNVHWKGTVLVLSSIPVQLKLVVLTLL